jgi:putative membrane protein
VPLATQPQFSWHHVSQWQLAAVPCALLLGAGVLYLWGASRASRWPLARSASFIAGLVVTLLATQSVIGVFDMAYFSDHMIQHLMLIMVAAPLFALARPGDLAYATGGARLQRALDSRVARLLTQPLVAFALYFVFIPLTHLTGVFNLMLEHEWFHHLEHIGFLFVGYLFFRAAFGQERGPALNPGLRLVYVMAAVPVDTITGLALAMESHSPFPAYRHTAPTGSTSASILSNIHLGGAIMWIGGDALMLLACIPIAITWVRYETVRTKELDADLDALGL